MKLIDNTKGFFQSKPGGVDDAGVRMPKQRSKASKLMDYVLPALVAMGGGAGLPFGLMAGRNISQGKKRQAEQDYTHRSKLAEERAAEAAAKRQKRADAQKLLQYKQTQAELDRQLKRDQLAKKLETKTPKPLINYPQFVKGKQQEQSWPHSFFNPIKMSDPKLQAEYRRDYLNQQPQAQVQQQPQPPESQLSNLSEEHLNTIHGRWQ